MGHFAGFGVESMKSVDISHRESALFQERGFFWQQSPQAVLHPPQKITAEFRQEEWL